LSSDVGSAASSPNLIQISCNRKRSVCFLEVLGVLGVLGAASNAASIVVLHFVLGENVHFSKIDVMFMYLCVSST
jgi:hypothetical protein